jgi:hypothetical protein
MAGFELCIYFLLAIWMFYMTVVFLCRLEFYKKLHLTLFYLTAWLVVFLRIIYLGIGIQKHEEGFETCAHNTEIFFMNVCDILCIYIYTLLGLVQMNKFASIAAEVNVFNHEQVNTQTANNRVDQKLLLVNVFTLVFAILVMCACAIDIYFLSAYFDARYPPDCVPLDYAVQ